MNIMNIIIIMLIITVLILKYFTKTIKNRLYYYPNTTYMLDKPNNNIEDIYIDNDNGDTLHGWYYNNKQNDNIILFCHGNAGNLTFRTNVMNNIIQIGYSFLLFDYRGFGKSTGNTFIDTTYDDTTDWFNYLIKTKKINKTKIIPMGESIGCYPAAKLAEKYQLSNLILLAGFHNISDVINNILVYPIGYFISLLAKGDLDVGSCLQNYKGNLLILHSKNDNLISYQNAINNNKYGGHLVEIQGDHNNPIFDWNIINKYIK